MNGPSQPGSELPSQEPQQQTPQRLVPTSSAAAESKAAANCYSWESGAYTLLDFGRGRKLERIGGRVLDRVCPAAESYSLRPDCDWSQAHLRLDAAGCVTSDHLTPEQAASTAWQCRWGPIVFNLKLTPFGHVGLFPEQASNWNWLIEVARHMLSSRGQPIRALNLFAYTGGSTLALASAGVQVVHVDASAPAVKWGQRNAASSGLDKHPIRWIVDDARKFVQRELRRGNRYDILVLDPPSYGHGTKGQRWSIETDLQPLLDNCVQLLHPSSAALLLTAHSVLPTAEQIVSWIDRNSALHCQHARLNLTSPQSKVLDAGFYIRGTQPPAENS